MRNRGYFAVGVYHPKTESNIGTLWRSAFLYNAAFIFSIGRRYKPKASDTPKSYMHIPLWNFQTFEEFKDHIPYNAQLVCVEMNEEAKMLHESSHPQQAIYLLGAEDYVIPKEILAGKQKIIIPSVKPQSMNVAVAGSIVIMVVPNVKTVRDQK